MPPVAGWLAACVLVHACSLHAHGIEVILDVVYNHTVESDDKDPYTISFRCVRVHGRSGSQHEALRQGHGAPWTKAVSVKPGVMAGTLCVHAGPNAIDVGVSVRVRPQLVCAVVSTWQHVCASCRGIDNKTYYMCDTTQYVQMLNYSGCGNTVNANHPQVRCVTRGHVAAASSEGGRGHCIGSLDHGCYTLCLPRASMHLWHRCHGSMHASLACGERDRAAGCVLLAQTPRGPLRCAAG